MKRKILITGDVQDVGYRPFLLGIAESLEIERFFADNILINGKKAVYALADSSREKVESFISMAESKHPENARVEKVTVEEYRGNVMKIENYYRYLSAMQLSKIATYGRRMVDKQDEHIALTKEILDKQDSMLEKQDSMLDKQDSMLGKQDEHIALTREILQETKHISAKQDEHIEIARSSDRKLDSISRAEGEE